MKNFIYYVPEARNVKPEVLEKAGLTEIVDYPIEQVGTKKGPDGKDGVLFRRAGMAGMIGYRADNQIWLKAPGGKYWVGFEGEKPGPKDLLRANNRGGIFVDMADGNEWLFPIGRFKNGSTPLATSIAYDDEGNLIAKVPEKQRSLADDAQRLFDALMLNFKSEDKEAKKELRDLPLDEAIRILTRFLGLNYHIGEPEAVLLDLFRTDDLISPTLAILDAHSIIQGKLAEKKTRPLPTDSPTSDGEEA